MTSKQLLIDHYNIVPLLFLTDSVDMNYCGGALIAPRVALSCAHCVAEDVYYEGNQFIVKGYKPGTTAGANGSTV